MLLNKVRLFFERGVGRWVLWVSCGIQVLAILLRLWAAWALGVREPTTRNVGLWMVAVVAATIWLACFGAYRRVCELPIVWDDLQPGQPPYSALESEKDLITFGAMAAVLVQVGLGV
jgi:hypothetical protein